MSDIQWDPWNPNPKSQSPNIRKPWKTRTSKPLKNRKPIRSWKPVWIRSSIENLLTGVPKNQVQNHLNRVTKFESRSWKTLKMPGAKPGRSETEIRPIDYIQIPRKSLKHRWPWQKNCRRGKTPAAALFCGGGRFSRAAEGGPHCKNPFVGQFLLSSSQSPPWSNKFPLPATFLHLCITNTKRSNTRKTNIQILNKTVDLN